MTTLSTYLSFVKQDVGGSPPLMANSGAARFCDDRVVVGEPAVSHLVLCHVWVHPFTDVVSWQERKVCYRDCLGCHGTRPQ